MTTEPTARPEAPPGSVPAWVERVSRLSWAYVGFVLAVGATTLAIAGLRDLVFPLVIAVLLAVIFAPAVDWLERRRVPRSLGAGALVVVITGLGALVVGVIVAGVTDRSDELRSQLREAALSLDGYLDDLSDRFALPSLSLGDATSTLVSGAAGFVGPLLNSTTALVSGLVLALILLYYLLKDGSELVRNLAVRRTPQASAQTERILYDSGQSIRSYGRGRTVLALVQGVAITLMLAVLDVPLAVTIGIVNFVGAFVPYVGALIGGAFAVLIALSAGGLDLAIWALVVVLVVNLVLENLLEPRLIGSSMSMHPIAVLLATVAGGLLAGLFGLIVAAPLASIGANLFRELRATGFFGPVPEPDLGSGHERPTDDRPHRSGDGSERRDRS